MLPLLSVPALRERRVALIPEILPPEPEDVEPAVIAFAPSNRSVERDGATGYAPPPLALVGRLLDVYG